MNQTSSPHDPFWTNCPGLRASAIDGGAAMMVIEVMLDALTRMPEGAAALAAACRERAGRASQSSVDASEIDLAAAALALALIEAAADLEPRAA
jgi:hypothetical protein